MSSSVRVRINEGADAQPILYWDSVWVPWKGQADWAIAGADEPQNRGGLRSKAALLTAVTILLFTDKRIPDNHPLKYLVGDDPRGWWGDGVDVDVTQSETDMGSLLWVFERAPLTPDIVRWVEAIALDALTPLINQGACVRIDAQATGEFALNRCDLLIQLYGRDGTQIFSQQFTDIWNQSVTSPPSPTFPAVPPS